MSPTQMKLSMMRAEDRGSSPPLLSAEDIVKRLTCPQRIRIPIFSVCTVSPFMIFDKSTHQYNNRPPPLSFKSPIPSPSYINIDSREFHSTAARLAPKKRRVSASSARKKKLREVIKEQKAKQRRSIPKREEKMTLEMVQQQQQQKQQQSGKKKSNPLQQHPRPRNSTAIPDPIRKQQKFDRKEVPRAFLTQTASTNVYIAKCAVMDETTGEMYIDPTSLFSEIVQKKKKKKKKNDYLATTSSTKRKQPQVHHRQHNLPHTFKNSRLHFFPPSSFPNFEPPSDGRTPEVAFLGRSNTGKSSLINALSSTINGSNTHLNTYSASSSSSSSSGGGELARTSKRPGRTQTINYFGLISNNREKHKTKTASSRMIVTHTQSKLYFIDLPGFGYASAPDESVDEWQKKTQEFLISRASSSSSSSSHASAKGSSPTLKRLYLLLDSRLSDPTLLDMTVMGWCDEYAIPYTTVLTKVDGSSRSQCVKLTNQLCMRYHSLYHHTAAAAAAASEDDAEMEVEEDSGGGGGGGEDEVYMDPIVYWTSAKDGLGMEELLLSIENNMFASSSMEEEGDLEYGDAYEEDIGDEYVDGYEEHMFDDSDDEVDDDSEDDNVYNPNDKNDVCEEKMMMNVRKKTRYLNDNIR